MQTAIEQVRTVEQPQLTPVLEMRGVSKHFGKIIANEKVDFDLLPGEIHALLGENGAGKSTLMGTIYGLHQPDEGEIWIRGEAGGIESPRQAIERGIAMVHQHFMLIGVMTVAENIVLGDEPSKGPFFDKRAAVKRVRELSERFGLEVDPNAVVEELSVGQQQRVEILRSLHHRADVLILDEPTAVLTEQETQELFKVLRTLTAQGTAVIFISHKLREVLEIADRVTVLRRGRKIETVSAKDKTKSDLAQLMVGREVLLRVEKEPVPVGESLLSISDLDVEDDRGLLAVRNLSLNVKAGEIVGIAGVSGNGQTELIEAIAGLRTPVEGSIEVDGKDITGKGVRAALKAGVAHIAEDRHRRGLVLDFSLTENLALRDYRKAPHSRFGWLSPRRMEQQTKQLLTDYDVRPNDPRARAGSLSGGNQQKIVIARELAQDPSVLIAAQPTRGLDVGAIEFVHRRLLAQREAGRAVLLISLELDEICSLSDRILVMYEGEIVGEFDPNVSENDLGIAMLGGNPKTPELS